MHRKIERTAAIVLGGHRSGTSVLARALTCLGVGLGEKFIEPNDENPKGFFENPDIVAFNDRLLAAMGLSWGCLIYPGSNDFACEEFSIWREEALALLEGHYAELLLFGLKDPRLCLLMPFWEPVLIQFGVNQVRYLVCVRNPLESALSQVRRFKSDPQFHTLGNTPEEGLLLWLCYMWRAIEHVAARGALFVSYENLLVQPSIELDRLAAFLDAKLDQVEVDQFQTEFLSSDLKRQDATVDALVVATEDYPEIAAIYKGMHIMASQGVQEKNALNALAALFPESYQFALLVSNALQKLYSRATQLAIGSGLELDEAGNILRYQEHALELSRSEVERGKNDLLEAQEIMRGLEADIRNKVDELETMSQQVATLSSFHDAVTNSRYWRLRKRWLAVKKFMKLGPGEDSVA